MSWPAVFAGSVLSLGSIVGVTRGQRAVAERLNERAERLAERHA